MQKMIVIVGPTASGKTGLAIELAKRIGGEVISADSRQIYKELDIGTEKVTKSEMEGVPHYCINIASPRRPFSVEQWRTYAKKAIAQITRKGKIPIMAGGTGQYIDALVYNVPFPAVKPDYALRNILTKKTAEELFQQLKKLDTVRAKNIERENPRRLIRAIEIATALGAVPPLTKQKPRYDVTWIGINPGLEVLEKRIEKRLGTTLRRGLVAETKKLREELGLSWKRINELGLEYRIVGEYLRKEITKEEMKVKLVYEVRRYAKRQLTWLKRNKNILWYRTAEEALHNLT